MALAGPGRLPARRLVRRRPARRPGPSQRPGDRSCAAGPAGRAVVADGPHAVGDIGVRRRQLRGAPLDAVADPEQHLGVAAGSAARRPDPAGHSTARGLRLAAREHRPLDAADGVRGLPDDAPDAAWAPGASRSRAPLAGPTAGTAWPARSATVQATRRTTS